MSAPKLSKLWTITANLALAYTTLNAAAAWWIFRNLTALLAKGWTVKWTCDGVTGPTGAGDTTNRLAAEANCTVRGAAAGNAQCYFVLQNSAGVQMLVAYQGATDDVIRVSYSPAALFTLAGTTTNQPTATDEVIVSAATSVVGTAVVTRKMSIWAADDQTAWRAAVFAGSGIQGTMSIEVATRIAGATTFPVPYVFSNFLRMNRDTLNDAVGIATPTYPEMSAAALGAANYRGWGGRIFTAGSARNCRMHGQICFVPAEGITNGNVLNNISNSGLLTSSQYASSLGADGAICWPINLWGERTANFDGPWATAIDWHQVVTNSLTVPAITDQMPGFDPSDVPGVSGGQTGVGDPRTNWWVAIGTAALWPWRNAAAAMEIA